MTSTLCALNPIGDFDSGIQGETAPLSSMSERDLYFMSLGLEGHNWHIAGSRFLTLPQWRVTVLTHVSAGGAR
jgi:hypothetical protein